MTALCPMDRGPGRPWFHADRSPARLITLEDATAALHSLWDAATDFAPEALDQAAALEASTRLAAIHAAHGIRSPRHGVQDTLALARQAAALADVADEFQAVAEYL